MLEINRAGSRYIYRIHTHDPLVIQRRENKHNGRWLNYAKLANADEARAALLALADEDDDPEAEWINQHTLLRYTGAAQ